MRNAIAATLCKALNATGDAETLAKAREKRTDHYERQILDLPRAPTRPAQPSPPQP